jgi:hypothetical protein
MNNTKQKLNINLALLTLLFTWISIVLVYQKNVPSQDIICLLFFVIINSYFVGLYFIRFLKIRYDIKGMVLSNTSIFFGLVFLAPILFLSEYIDSSFILIGLTIFNLFYLWSIKSEIFINWDMKSLVPSTIASLVTVVFFGNYYEILSASPMLYKTGFKDYYFWTAVTSSIKDFDFSNTIYEQNAGIYYHVLGFFPAASIAGYAKVSSQLALWSISMPLMIFSAYLSIHSLLEQFVPKLKMFIVIGALLVFILHFPLNPKCFFNGHLNEMVWFGAGHTLPVLPTWAAVYCVVILLFLVLEKINKMSLVNIFVISGLAVMLALAKVTAIFVFYPLYLLYVLWLEKRIFTIKVITLIVSLIPVFFLIIFYYSKSSSKFVLDPGTYLISENLHTDKLDFFNYLSALLVSLIMTTIWIGIKAFIVFYKNRKSRLFFWALIFTFFICVLLQSVFRILNFSSRGELIGDGSFDLLQFTRSVFIYFDLFALVLFVIMLDRFYFENSNVKRVIICSVVGYSVVVLVIIINNLPFYLHNSHIVKPKWATQVIVDLRPYTYAKKAMVSDDNYSGQFISAHDITGFVFCLENGKGGYTTTNINYYLYKDFSKFIDGANPAFIDVIKRYKIDILIATPNTIEKFKKLEQNNTLKRIAHSRWLYTPIFK